jgi:hypothetical protein
MLVILIGGKRSESEKDKVPRCFVRQKFFEFAQNQADGKWQMK